MDAAANSAAPPNAVAASVFAGPRRERARDSSSDEARFGRRSVSVGPSPFVRSARIEAGFQGSASSPPSRASADARHDTRTARRPVGRHDTRDATRARPNASVEFLLTTERAETSARLGRIARAGAIGSAPGAARSDMAARAAFASAEEGYVTRARNTGVDDRDAIGSFEASVDETEKSAARALDARTIFTNARPSPFTDPQADARGSRFVASRTRVRSLPDHRTRTLWASRATRPPRPNLPARRA